MAVASANSRGARVSSRHEPARRPMPSAGFGFQQRHRVDGDAGIRVDPRPQRGERALDELVVRIQEDDALGGDPLEAEVPRLAGAQPARRADDDRPRGISGTSTSDALSTTMIGTCASWARTLAIARSERGHVARAPHGDHHGHCGSREAQASALFRSLTPASLR